MFCQQKHNVHIRSLIQTKHCLLFWDIIKAFFIKLNTCTLAEIEEQEPTPCLEAPASDSLEVNDLKQNGNGEAVSAVTQPQKCSSVENTEPNTKDLRSVAQQELNVKQDSTTDTTGKGLLSCCFLFFFKFV